MSPVNKNKIDFTRYVAMGDSITSGYSDGALYYEGQVNSYANILAGQFKLITTGNFNQPLMRPDSVGTNLLGKSRLVLRKLKDKADLPVLSLIYLSEQGDTSALSESIFRSDGPFNNMSVPGAKTITTLANGFGNPANGEGNYNPFFTRMASDAVTASVLSDAMKIDPTFFSLFIGNNDVLGFALSGGTLDVITPASGEPGIGFEGSIRSIVNALTSKGAKGVIANIPDLNSVPYFITIPANGLLVTHDNISLLNAKYELLGIKLHTGRNNFVIEDPFSYSNGIRQIQKGEFILLDILLDKHKKKYLEAEMPIPKKYILTHSDIFRIQTSISQYNGIIKSITEEKKLALVDINSLVQTAPSDRTYNIRTQHLHYKKKGVFSLDGLHPNAFGQALLANEFIASINNTYGTTIPVVDSSKFAGNKFP
jgi:lysophospholipase L1-like esterase